MYESADKMVSHPSHYQSKYGFEVIDVIDEYTRELKGVSATDTGNMIKYICRWKMKNGIQDLEKAIWYASHLAERYSKFMYNGIRCYWPRMSYSEIIEAYTDGLDETEAVLTSKALYFACDWWTCEDKEGKLYAFIEVVKKLINYEREKENTHES